MLVGTCSPLAVSHRVENSLGPVAVPQAPHLGYHRILMRHFWHHAVVMTGDATGSET